MSYVLLCKIVGNATLGKVVNWRTAVALPYAYDKVDKGEDNTGERNGSYNKHLWNNPPPRIARYTTVYFGRFHSDASQRQDIYSAREVKYLSKPCFKIQDARTRLLWPDERTAPIDSKRGRWSRRRSPVCCKEVFSSRRSIGFLSQLPSSSFTDR